MLETTAPTKSRTSSRSIARRSIGDRGFPQTLRVFIGIRMWGFFLLGALLSIQGCGGPQPRPDLKRLYQSAYVVSEQPPLILIPGIMGARLRDTSIQQVVWPGGLWRLMFHHYDELALQIDPQTLEGSPGSIEAFGLTDTTAGQHFYDTIIDTLVDSG